MTTRRLSRLVALSLLAFGLITSPAGAADPYPGYTLFTVGQTIHLFDLDKQPVHEWTIAEGSSIKTSAYLLADGSVLVPLKRGDFPFRPGGAHGSGTFQRISWQGEVVWDYQFFGDDFTPSYDVEPMPNGNIMVCAAYQDRSFPGKLFEIEPVGKNGGKVVWECNVTEKLGREVQGYINSVSYNAATDQVLVNIQQPGRTLAVFDHSKPSADLVFKWSEGFSGRIHGGSWATDRYVGSALVIPGSDAAKMRAGNLLTVSNSDHQVVEIDPRTNQRVKVFPYQFSDHQGSAQRLPNGNTLIVSGYTQRIDEVDDAGNVVWSMETPGRISRALRYGLEYPGVAKLKK